MEGHSLQQPALRYGVSQGSVIAPLLFSIMLYDINKIQKHDAVITLYADDLAIWKESKGRRFTNITKTNCVSYDRSKSSSTKIINTVKQYMFHNGFSMSYKKKRCLSSLVPGTLCHQNSELSLTASACTRPNKSNIWVLPSSGQVASPNMFIVISSRPFGPLT